MFDPSRITARGRGSAAMRTSRGSGRAVGIGAACGGIAPERRFAGTSAGTTSSDGADMRAPAASGSVVIAEVVGSGKELALRSRAPATFSSHGGLAALGGWADAASALPGAFRTLASRATGAEWAACDCKTSPRVATASSTSSAAAVCSPSTGSKRPGQARLKHRRVRRTQSRRTHHERMEEAGHWRASSCAARSR